MLHVIPVSDMQRKHGIKGSPISLGGLRVREFVVFHLVLQPSELKSTATLGRLFVNLSVLQAFHHQQILLCALCITARYIEHSMRHPKHVFAVGLRGDIAPVRSHLLLAPVPFLLNHISERLLIFVIPYKKVIKYVIPVTSF